MNTTDAITPSGTTTTAVHDDRITPGRARSAIARLGAHLERQSRPGLPGTPVRRPVQIGLAGLAVVVLAACGGSDGDSSGAVTRDILGEQLAEQTDLDTETAGCIVDEALNERSLEDLVEIGSGDELSPELEAEIMEVTIGCITGTISSDGESDDLAAEEAAPADTAPPASDAPVATDAPPMTDAPLTTDAPATTDAPPTTDDIEIPTFAPVTELHVPYCGAGAQVHIALAGAELIPEDDPAYMEATFADISSRLGDLFEAAPPVLAERTVTFKSAIDSIDIAMSTVDYEWSVFVDTLSPDFAREAMIVEALTDDLETYLEDVCMNDIEFLDGLGESWAFTLTNGEVGDPAPVLTDDEPVDSPPAPFVNATDDLERITVDVPTECIDVDGAPIGEVANLIVSTDVDEYRRSWNVDGLQIATMRVGSGANGAAVIGTTEAAGDCTLVSVEPYDDGAYTGEIARYADCALTDTGAVVVGADNSDGSLEVVVTAQFVGGIDEDVLDEILFSFLAR